MTATVDTSSGWQVSARQVGEAVPLQTEQSASADLDPDAEFADTNVIPMHPDPQPTTEHDEGDCDGAGEQSSRPHYSLEELDPKPAEPEPPAASFPMRNAILVGYVMSVTIGAIGQIWALGTRLGGTQFAWVAATFAAAFAEVCMIGAGSWSLENRKNGRSWLPLLVGAGAVCGYAVGLQLVHYIPMGVGLAAVFAGGSVAGWSLHMAVEHIRVSSYRSEYETYKRELAEWQNRQLKEMQKQQPKRSSKPNEPQRPRTAVGTVRTASKTKTGGTGKQSKPQLTQQDVVQLVQSGQLGNGDGPAKVRHLVAGQYTPPAASTLKRWIAEARKSRAASA